MQDKRYVHDNSLVIDLYGNDIPEIQQRFPKVYRWLFTHVKPEREQNNRARYREYWWLFAEPRPGLREAINGLGRYACTSITAKHRQFVFLDTGTIPDAKLAIIAHDDAFCLGILSSRIHAIWAAATGGTLGSGQVYNKTVSFDAFPFPASDNANLVDRIRGTAESIDKHRKDRQAEYPKLTLTGMYNVLEQLRDGDELSPKDAVIREQGDVDTLLALHDDLDAAVVETYGWPSDLSDDEIIQLLFDLNQRRAEEEQAGQVRWLRQDWQNN